MRALRIVLVVVVLVGGCTGGPREEKLSEILDLYDTLIENLEDFRPGESTRKIEWERPGSKKTVPGTITSTNSTAMAEGVRAIVQAFRKVPISVLEENPGTFNDWAKSARTQIGERQVLVRELLSALRLKVETDPEQYAANVRINDQGELLFRSYSRSTMGNSLTSLSAPGSGFDIEADQIWQLDIEGWLSEIASNPIGKALHGDTNP